MTPSFCMQQLCELKCEYIDKKERLVAAYLGYLERYPGFVSFPGGQPVQVVVLLAQAILT